MELHAWFRQRVLTLIKVTVRKQLFTNVTASLIIDLKTRFLPKMKNIQKCIQVKNKKGLSYFRICKQHPQNGSMKHLSILRTTQGHHLA